MQKFASFSYCRVFLKYLYFSSTVHYKIAFPKTVVITSTVMISLDSKILKILMYSAQNDAAFSSYWKVLWASTGLASHTLTARWLSAHRSSDRVVIASLRSLEECIKCGINPDPQTWTCKHLQQSCAEEESRTPTPCRLQEFVLQNLHMLPDKSQQQALLSTQGTCCMITQRTATKVAQKNNIYIHQPTFYKMKTPKMYKPLINQCLQSGSRNNSLPDRYVIWTAVM